MAAAHHPYSMGETGENVAERLGVSRGEQDEFALRSQRNAARAVEAGRYDEQLVAISVPQRKGDPIVVRSDEHPRPETTIEALTRLKPAFREGGTVTAGNSSGINDGASAVLVVEAARARALGLQPLARVVATAVAGVDPALMGLGPIPATRKVLERAGLNVTDLDLIELNEAFASQSVACIRELGLDPEKVNVDGGAIALGHPLGASGGRLVTTLVHSLRRTGGRYGLATMCIGVGQGIAMIVERL
jgi:acetyl-CoA acetyltransferase family protein